MNTRYNKIIAAFIMGCGLAATMTSCSQDKEYTMGMPESKALNKIELKVSDVLPVAVGMDTTLVCKVEPDNADNKNLLWTSSDELVATVSPDGTITGHREGTAIITVVPALGFGVQGKTQRSITVKVVPTIIKATSITFTNTTTEIFETDQLKLTYDILPADHTYDHLLFSSSDESVATVDENGVVTGIKKGKATIYGWATDKSGVVGKIDITVRGFVPATSVTITPPATDQMYIGQALTLTYTATPADATASSIEWESSDETVLRVKDGVVTAAGLGTATITAKCTETGATSVVSLTVASGWFVWGQETDFKGWYSPTSGAKVEDKGDRLTVTVGTGNRADLKRNGTFEMDFGNYPVLALRMQNVGATYAADIVTVKGYAGVENGITASSAACPPIDLGDGTVLVYVVVTKPEVLNGMVPYRQFGFKVTKIGADHTTYDIHWIRTFKSEAEMKAFVGI